MSYTAPRTWVTLEFVDVTLFNTHIRDNLIALKDPNSAVSTLNESSDYTTTSTTFVDVDATDGKLSLSLTLTVTADVFIFFTGGGETDTAPYRANFDVTQDGIQVGGDDGLTVISQTGVSNAVRIGFCHLCSAVAAGTHTYKLQWKTSAGTFKLYAGAGTALNKDIHPQFIVREMS
jgi:hypothetical protein